MRPLHRVVLVLVFASAPLAWAQVDSGTGAPLQDAPPSGPAVVAAPMADAGLVGAPAQPPAAAEPFAFADFTWAPANGRTTESPLGNSIFTGEFRLDAAFHHSFAEPIDHTISGSSEVFRSGEFQVTMLGIGGDLHYKNVIGRVMTQFGLYSETTPRNDASPGLGQWNLADAYRYISEAYGGYHLDYMNGVNIEAGIFMSYVGLWSYYQSDNWTYQPSFVSSNTPWFFNGARVQFFLSDKLKIEPWLINGWQSYGRFNNAPGVGVQILYKPTGWLIVLGNQYVGTDQLGIPDRKRIHTDDSIMVKYYDNPKGWVSKAAASLTLDLGCEWGGVASSGTQTSCFDGNSSPGQYFIGFMAYTRVWFVHDLFALTGGGGAINNPGRYLVLLPPVNGATAFSGTSAFTENPGDQFKAWDMQLTGDFMPNQFVTFRLEYTHRYANVPYWAGHLGLTPPGGNQGAPGSAVAGWSPDLTKTEDRMTLALLVKM